MNKRSKEPFSTKNRFLRGAIALAVNGIPIFNPLNNRGEDAYLFGELDEYGGHCGRADDYHYHATKTYPYLNGGFYGQVAERDGQVDPQPRAEPLRPALSPMRDARITGFVETKSGSYRLTYDVRGKKGSVSYTLNISKNR